MGRRRIDKPLTASEQELVAKAFALAERVIDRHDRRYGDRHADWSSEVAERFVRSIRLYDPTKSLRGWAVGHAVFACREALRNKVPRPSSRKGNKRLRFVSLDAMVPGGSKLTYAETLVDPARPPDDLEAAHHLLRGLGASDREIVWESVVEGRTLVAIARERGLDDSRISQMRTLALKWLRKNLNGDVA